MAADVAAGSASMPNMADGRATTAVPSNPTARPTATQRTESPPHRVLVPLTSTVGAMPGNGRTPEAKGTSKARWSYASHEQPMRQNVATSN